MRLELLKTHHCALVNYLPIFPYFSKEFEKQWTKPNAKNSENNWALTKLFCNFKFANDFDSKAFTFSDFAIYGQMKKKIFCNFKFANNFPLINRHIFILFILFFSGLS